MVPTLNGRIQTRIALLAIIGGLWTLIITPALPLGGTPLSEGYRSTFLVLATVIVLGVAWEFLYHLLQQFRWEKDWPTLFGLVTGVNEGALVGALLYLGWIPGSPHAGLPAFVILFVTVWIVVWLFANGPMRIFSVHWRLFGGALVRGR